MSIPLIKKLRKALGLSQEAFARAIGKSYPSVRNYEDGRKLPPDVLGRMLFLARSVDRADLVEEIEREGEHLYDSLIQAEMPAEPDLVALTPEARQGLHSLLDYVLDAVGPESVWSLREILRVYSIAARCMGDPLLDVPEHFEGPPKKGKVDAVGREKETRAEP